MPDADLVLDRAVDVARAGSAVTYRLALPAAGRAVLVRPDRQRRPVEPAGAHAGARPARGRADGRADLHPGGLHARRADHDPAGDRPRAALVRRRRRDVCGGAGRSGHVPAPAPVPGQGRRPAPPSGPRPTAIWSWPASSCAPSPRSPPRTPPDRPRAARAPGAPSAGAAGRGRLPAGTAGVKAQPRRLGPGTEAAGLWAAVAADGAQVLQSAEQGRATGGVVGPGQAAGALGAAVGGSAGATARTSTLAASRPGCGRAGCGSPRPAASARTTIGSPERPSASTALVARRHRPSSARRDRPARTAGPRRAPAPAAASTARCRSRRPAPCGRSGAGSPCGRPAGRSARRGPRRRRGCRGRRRRSRPAPGSARRRTRPARAAARSGRGCRGWRPPRCRPG